MKKYILSQLSTAESTKLCERSAISFGTVLPVVQPILEEVKARGNKAVSYYEGKFGNSQVDLEPISQKEIDQARESVPLASREAFAQAAKNITLFHQSQLSERRAVETMPGVTCFAQSRGIEKVGLYIPGGSVPLPSTVLMLAIPAKLAGCKETTLVTPAGKDGRIPPSILYVAKLCKIDRIYKVGGAQAIAALAYGTETIPKIDKIFGPGNQYVTAAKMLVSIDPAGAAIDMPAGPTEVLVVADETARSDFVAADLLAQAEHGVDSQVVLVCTSDEKTEGILQELADQLQRLPRNGIAQKALANSFAVVVETLDQAIDFANSYAPEHLIINASDSGRLVPRVQNAGSVFLGQYSCESAGDYASGTNHSLPTYGYAKAYSGVSVASFQKQITFQQVTKEGAALIGPVVAIMAGEEQLEGHKRAMQVRYKEM